jgi:hypothetical protein
MATSGGPAPPEANPQDLRPLAHFAVSATGRPQLVPSTPRATLIKSMLVGDLLILLRKHRIKAALAASAHSRLN